MISFKTLGSVLLWVLAPLLIGWWVAQAYVPQPAVGVIKLNSDIWFGSADLVLRQLEAARENPDIKAIVLQIDSPGGEVVPTQQLYSEVMDLRQDMPVVASIGSLAASGGFYLAMAADPIYAQPSSSIGNVGVWGFTPSELAVNDIVLASGPFKLSASNRTEFLREIEAIKQEFIVSVTSQRGDRLNISPETLAQGLTYPGREARNLGLIDHLGSPSEAVTKAAELAGIANYRTIDLEAQVFEALMQESNVVEPWLGAADPLTGRRNLPPGLYLLYDEGMR